MLIVKLLIPNFYTKKYTPFEVHFIFTYSAFFALDSFSTTSAVFSAVSVATSATGASGATSLLTVWAGS